MAEAVDEMSYLEGWTVQSETSPVPPPAEAPQLFVETQLPAELPAEDYVPGDLITDDPALLDPDDRVLAGAAPYEPEPPADFGDPPPSEDTVAGAASPAPEAAPEAAPAEEETVDLEAMTKAEIQTWADENGYEVNLNTQSKGEMIDAIMEQQG